MADAASAIPFVGAACVKKQEQQKQKKSEKHRNMWKTFNNRARLSMPDFFSVDIEAPELPKAPSQLDLELALLQLRHCAQIADEQVEHFRTRRYIRLSAVIPAALLSAARCNVQKICMRAMGGRNPSLPVTDPQPRRGNCTGDSERWWAEVSEPTTQSWHIQKLWAIDPIVRAIVLSPRIGDIVCRLLGCENVRLYHDNFLSRAPGSRRTFWHCDDGPDGYMIMEGTQVVTVWFPLHRCTPQHGSIVFPKSQATDLPKTCLSSWDTAQITSCPADEKSVEYDLFCAKALEDSGATPSEATYELGDLSVHASDCFHSTGPNHSGSPRMIFGVTYFADNTTARTDKSLDSMTQGQRNDWANFAPGVLPGEKIATKFNPVLHHCDRGS